MRASVVLRRCGWFAVAEVSQPMPKPLTPNQLISSIPQPENLSQLYVSSNYIIPILLKLILITDSSFATRSRWVVRINRTATIQLYLSQGKHLIVWPAIVAVPWKDLSLRKRIIHLYHSLQTSLVERWTSGSLGLSRTAFLRSKDTPQNH